jgi:hypothetical protein
MLGIFFRVAEQLRCQRRIAGFIDAARARTRDRPQLRLP